MIRVYKSGDDSLWVPVAKDSHKFGARAFLPFLDMEALYIHGYKAQPENSKYFEALASIQDAYLKNESREFIVENGNRKERQYKAKWRHGRLEGAPLLGPSKGWVEVPLASLNKVSDQDLSNTLDQSSSEFVRLQDLYVSPVLCSTDEVLCREVSHLTKNPPLGSPTGQTRPEQTTSETKRFIRDATVVAYVLRLAEGHCEFCKMLSPFIKADGSPFLEVHHVKWLADGGSDTISNAVALCPNCHREFHYGKNATNLKTHVYSVVSRLIPE